MNRRVSKLLTRLLLRLEGYLVRRRWGDRSYVLEHKGTGRFYLSDADPHFEPDNKFFETQLFWINVRTTRVFIWQVGEWRVARVKQRPVTVDEQSKRIVTVEQVVPWDNRKIALHNWLKNIKKHIL